jgi:hypothetical protein
MSYSEHKKPLFRKVNTKAHGVRHRSGGDFSDVRNAKKETRERALGTKHRGLDYTPLFKFLLSKVGQDWDAIYKEAVSRLDRQDPIFWLVALTEDEQKETVCIGESSFYSGLFVDDDNILKRVNPHLKAADMQPDCTCCTHTFNGILFGSEE